MRPLMIFIPLFCVLLLAGPGFPVQPCGAATLFQQVGIASPPLPVGSGARAMGMGGAFIAVADDATAASWNPGGLIQLEKPELSMVGPAMRGTATITRTAGRWTPRWLIKRPASTT